MAKTKKTTNISDRTPPVNIEYDWGSKGERRTKKFEDAHDAKKFYATKDKAGKNPKVQKAAEDTAGTPTATKDAPAATTSTPTPKPAKAPGVRAMRSRPYLAGTIIAKHGLTAGVTAAMVAELDEDYGRPNAHESWFCLKNAWHSARGYNGLAEDAIE